MEQNESPTPDFLKIIISLESKLDETTFTQLFIRVCRLYKGEELEIRPVMAKKAIKFLADNGDNIDSSLGLLGLIYHNDIALTDFNEDLLIRYQGGTSTQSATSSKHCLS